MKKINWKGIAEIACYVIVILMCEACIFWYETEVCCDVCCADKIATMKKLVTFIIFILGIMIGKTKIINKED